MRIPANIDRDTLKVYVDAEPTFELKEVIAITTLLDGRQQVSYGRNITFDAADWKRLEASDGDFDVLGINLKKDHPVEGFMGVGVDPELWESPRRFADWSDMG